MLSRHGVILSVPTSILLSITAHYTISGNSSITPSFALSNNQLMQLRRWMSTSTHHCPKTTPKMHLCKVKCPDSLGGQVSFCSSRPEKKPLLACNSSPHHWNIADNFHGCADICRSRVQIQHLDRDDVQPTKSSHGVHWLSHFQISRHWKCKVVKFW